MRTLSSPLLLVLGLLLMVRVAQGQAQPTSPLPLISAHDPVMVRQEGTYYMFCTGPGIAVWSSKDRQNWTREQPVFASAPAWATQAGGDVARLRIAYAVYGQYVDMGVGRGMGAGVRRATSDYARIRDERGQLHQHSRRARPFSSKEIGRQSVRLGVLLSEYYGETTIAHITEALPGPVNITL